MAKMDNTKSQTAIEFLILVGLVLFGFTVFFMIIQGNMSDDINEQRDLAIKELALSVQNEIDLASQSAEGYQRKFRLPATINGMDYTIDIDQNMVYITAGDGNHAMALPVQNTTGTIIIGVNTIKKEDGQVKINT